MTLAELAQRPDPQWHIDQHFPAESLALLVGASGVGKSFVALDYAMCVTTGRPYLGCYDVVRPGPVVYIAAEGSAGLKKRVAAWMKHNGVTDFPPDMIVIPAGYNFADNDERDALLTTIDTDLPGQPVLVVVDTLARNLVGDENSPEDMAAFVAMCDYLRTHLGCTVLVLHHVGKDPTRKERGHSSLRGAADTLLLLEESGGGKGVLVRCDKQKDYEPFEPYVLSKHKIVLGDDLDSLVLVGQDQTRTRYQLAPAELKSFVGRLAEVFGSDPFAWTQAREAVHPVPKSTFYRHLGQLLDRRLVKKQGERYLIPAATLACLPRI